MITIGKTTYKTARDGIMAHHAKCTGKHKPVKSKGAIKRLYPLDGANMTTAQYVAAYERLNVGLTAWDWQPLSTTLTTATGEDSAWEVADHDAD